MKTPIDTLDETTLDLEADLTGPEAHRSVPVQPVRDLESSGAAATLESIAVTDPEPGLVTEPDPGFVEGGGPIYGDDGDNTRSGTFQNDEIHGLGGNDTLSGSNGRDYLYGGDDNDTLYGDAGSDTLDGGAGYDTLVGGLGADLLNGGEGFDTARYDDGWVHVNLADPTLNAGGAAGDMHLGIEQFSLSNYGDVFIGSGGNDIVYSLDGDDSLFGGEGNDLLSAGDGQDALYGGTGYDYLSGGHGDDILNGDAGNDWLDGNDGADTLVGGLGGDLLAGGGDADIFRYTAVEESQIVTINGVEQLDQFIDFVQGEDKIDLSAIDANGGLAGDQAFAFLANPGNYTGSWTGLVWQTTDASGIATINVSIDADADAEMQINMSHAYQFTASDFIL